MKVEKLFVYGTLGPGRPNENILSNIGGSWEPAVVSGTLHDEGWGAEMGYPGIVLDDQGGDVDGFLFISCNLEDHWELLDEFEGEGYERVPTKARLRNGSSVDTYVYALKQR